MAYEKRVCVLRQVRKGFSADGSALTGAVYAERLGSELTITPRIGSLSPLRDGRYLLYLWADGRTFCLELKGTGALTVSDAPTLRHGFAALVCFCKGEPEPVAFGRCGAAPEGYAALLAGSAPGKRSVPLPVPPVQVPAPAPNVPLAPTVPLPEPLPEDDAPHAVRAAARYNDEAIASADYFTHKSNGDGAAQAEAEQETGAAAPPDARDLLLRPRKTLTYYYEVKEKLDAAFAEGERDERLCALFPRSEWVKRGGALLGIISEEGVPRWLCAACEALGAPPEAMGKHAVFVPRSHFSNDEGFWVVFQDADTGEYVTPAEE